MVKPIQRLAYAEFLFEVQVFGSESPDVMGTDTSYDEYIQCLCPPCRIYRRDDGYLQSGGLTCVGVGVIMVAYLKSVFSWRQRRQVDD